MPNRLSMTGGWLWGTVALFTCLVFYYYYFRIFCTCAGCISERYTNYYKGDLTNWTLILNLNISD